MMKKKKTQVFSFDETVSGWDISAEDQLTYNRWIADQVRDMQQHPDGGSASSRAS